MNNRCLICGVNLVVGTNSNVNNHNKCNRCEVSRASLALNNPIKSVFYLFDGFRVLIANKKFIKLSIMPLILTFIILISTYTGGIYLVISGLNHYLPSAENQGMIGTLSKYALGAVGSLFILFITFFLFLPLSSLVCIPFNDIISLETEKNILGEEKVTDTDKNRSLSTGSPVSLNPGSETRGILKTNNLLEVRVGIMEALKLLFFKVIILAVALPLNFIPTIGNLLFLLILSLVTAIDFLDIVMARKRYSLSEKLKFIKGNSINFLFFSMPFFVLFWIPIVQILIIPCAAIAGTKFFIESKKFNS